MLSKIPIDIEKINPETGEGLTPQDEPKTVDISIIVPDEINAEFEGYITVVNLDDSNDTDIIPVSITTPRQRSINHPFFKNLYRLLSDKSVFITFPSSFLRLSRSYLLDL